MSAYKNDVTYEQKYASGIIGWGYPIVNWIVNNLLWYIRYIAWSRFQFYEWIFFPLFRFCYSNFWWIFFFTINLKFYIQIRFRTGFELFKLIFISNKLSRLKKILLKKKTNIMTTIIIILTLYQQNLKYL